MKPESIKVLVACHTDSGGGAEHQAVTTAGGLKKLGYDVSFLMHYKNHFGLDPIDSNVPTYIIEAEEAKYNAMGQKEKNRLFKETLKKINPAIIFSFSTSSSTRLGLLKFGRRIPLVDFRMNSRNHRHQFLAYLFSKKIVIQTPEQRKLVSACFRRKTLVISNPLKEGIEAIHRGPLDRIQKFVAIGRLAAAKNYFFMLQVIKIIKEQSRSRISLDIYGSGDQKPEIINYIQENQLSDNVVIHDFRSDVIDQLTQYDAYLLTSEFEGLPNALMEAMAVGLIAYARDIPTGPRFLIGNNERGFLDTDNNPEKFAQMVLASLDDINIINQKKEAGREYLLNKFSRTVISGKLSQLIQKFARRKKQ